MNEEAIVCERLQNIRIIETGVLNREISVVGLGQEQPRFSL